MRIDWNKINYKQVLGAILVISVVGVGTLYLSDIRWLLSTNPNQNLFVIHHPDKNEINVIQRTQGLSFNRYRVTKDEVCQYQGRNKVACYKWYLDYYRTYGEDQWVRGLWRKSSLISMDVQEDKKQVVVRRITPYYAYNYASGYGGEIIETIFVFQDHTDINVRFEPENKNRLNQLRLKVTDLDSNVIPFDFGDRTTIRFDDTYNFVFHWDGSTDLFQRHWTDGEDVELWFKPMKGEIKIGN